MRLFFSVGEPSGDLHGANLIKEIRQRSKLTAVGLGGQKMNAAGCELVRDMNDLAVMGFFPVLAKLPEFLRLRSLVAQRLDESRPDAVVLIDFPGFNWHVARLAKERGIPVIYYGLPQLWAWASWRVRKVQKYVDHALCKLPFEEAWFREQNCQATYVGHPYFDELGAQSLDDDFMGSLAETDERVLTLLPGSRTQEVRYNLPVLLKAGAEVRRKIRGVRLVVASYNERQAELARRLVAAGPAPAEVYVNRTPELISASACCLACSGSVSLELLHHAKPAAIVYRASWLTYKIVRPLIKVRYITLVNLLASEQPFSKTAVESECPLYPEYPTWSDRSSELAQHAIGWLSDEPSRQEVITKLVSLRAKVANAGASATAADYIVKHLASTQEAGQYPPAALRRAS